MLSIFLRILPVPGQGPSMKLQRQLGHWEHNMVAVTEGPNPKIFKGTVEVRGLSADFSLSIDIGISLFLSWHDTSLVSCSEKRATGLFCAKTKSLWASMWSAASNNLG